MSEAKQLLNILIVDDNLETWPPIFASKFREQFEMLGSSMYELNIEVTVPAWDNFNRTRVLDRATEMLNSCDYDFVIFDWNLGDKGEEFADSLKVPKITSEKLILERFVKHRPLRICSGSRDTFDPFLRKTLNDLEIDLYPFVIRKNDDLREADVDVLVSQMLEEMIAYKESRLNTGEGDPISKV